MLGVGGAGLVLATAVLALVPSGSEACPSRCLCFRTTVRCMHLQLDRIPQVAPTTTILDLRFNKIREIPPGAFEGLLSLNTLLLNNNDIRKIPRGAFQGLSSLKYLYLYKNKIRHIDRQAFVGLSSLEQLYIHFNEIEQLLPNTFSNLPSLERLFLHNNKLARIPAGTFSNLHSLKRLRLDSNDLVCDCQLMWLAELLKKYSSVGSTQAAATCKYPKALEGRSVSTITPEEFHCVKPHFTAEPSDVDVTHGNTVYFSCHAEGDPKPEIVWLHNSNEVQIDDERHNMLDDGTLMIQDTRPEDQGMYECMARNIAGEVKTKPAELRYFNSPASPTFTVSPQDTEVLAGQSVTLECSASGYPLPEITWSRHDRPGPPPPALPTDPRFTVMRSGALHITNVRQEDHGLYRCEAANDQDTIVATAQLIVQAAPRITVRPQDADVVEGTSVEFDCRAEGHPAPVIVWTVNGNQLPDDRRFTVLSSGILRISRVTSYDRGTYECQAVNVASVDRARADLTVKARVTPTFTETPTDLTVQPGGEISLPCSAVGEPQPAITWSKDGIQISESSKYGLSAIGHLIIRGVDQSDTGRYECSARNTIGFVSTSMQFTVLVSETNNFIGDPFVGPSIQRAINSVDREINRTRNDLFSRPTRPRTPSELLQLMRFPSPEALSLARAAEVFERTLQLVRQEVEHGMKLNLEDSEYSYTELISPSHLRLVANLSGCSTHQQTVNCSDRICFHQRYRSFDGTCNNFQHPMWGAALTPFRRLLKPIYENGFNTPVGWNRSHLYFGFSKPSSRGVSTQVLSTSTTTPDSRYSHMVMQWGQFLDHDLDLAVESSSEFTFSTGLRCNETCDNTPPCFPIEIPRGDPRIRHRCMEFRRSSAVCGTGSTSLFFNEVTPREQINTLTSFLDASNVYGSNDLYATQIRDLSNRLGLLKGGLRQANGKYLLPYNTELPIDCQRGQHDSPIPCFLAGDVRSNEQLGLLSMHTLWMREHNRVARELRRLNPHWDGDTIYHEGRKIVGAEMQHITFAHWMPKFVGQKGMELIGEYRGYDPNTNPSIINAFATAAYRIGHTLINPMIFRLNASFQEIPEGHLPLHQAFFSPQRVVEEGGIDPVLRGLFATPLKQRNSREFVNTELTERLFEMAHHIALDLAALNIQRGRDHALPGYNDWRTLCNMTAVNDWDSLRHQISDPQLRDRLRQLYGHPGNLDLFVAGAVEDLVPGSLLGPTFLCIITQQFRNIRDGDRFWYENPGVFKPSQLSQLRQASLARVLCDNGDSIDRVQHDVFLNADFPTGYVYCDNVPRMDLTAWTECCEDCANSAEFGTVSGTFRKRRSARYSERLDSVNFLETAKQRRKTAKMGKQEEFVAMKHRRSGGSSKHRLSKPRHDRVDTVAEYHALGQNVTLTHESDRVSRLEYGMMMMQDIAGDLQRAVSQLTRKVREFEVQLEHLQTCKDEEGNRYQDGDTWDPDDCTACRCQEGKATCVRQKCPEKSCAKPLLIPGECCPVCV
ncbi:peroxidasin-like isoform X2 [Branchiostoma floridae x Branchiostoma belcheri]